ncbi:MAG TPA: Ldh family oxidoreductase [Candidatus Baltobacteraceae bacterium]|nr:Ldh family oxidoreductase [Candidatus Baltobacteraceae bacterium]
MRNAVTSKYFLTTEEKLKHFIVDVLERSGVARAHAEVTADVLVEADLRGIESHGVARLESYYVARIRSGHLNPQPNYRVVRESKTSIVFDADNGLGHPVSKMAMESVIAKAQEFGSAFGGVRNSNHYGIAGYYAMMALEHDMIGMSATNSVKYAAATFGREVTLGTNPFAFAVPAGNEPSFVLDFATTTVPKGKIEVYKRKDKELEPGWAIDEQGNMTADPDEALRGALLPLGGFGMEGGGHKGYGLGLLADILCGVLSGGCFGPTLPFADETKKGAISHWFGAFRVDGFRDVAEFKEDMDVELRYFKDSAVARGAQRIMVAGEPEILKAAYHRQYGVPVHAKVWDGLKRIADELDLDFNLER